ncbi:MAG: hypothetical protein LBQ24_05985 [Candidatus Peribacteria bacterium]|nr:hypothetical protein [Candidatus Peribacteria bacterium]
MFRLGRLLSCRLLFGLWMYLGRILGCSCCRYVLRFLLCRLGLRKW